MKFWKALAVAAVAVAVVAVAVAAAPVFAAAIAATTVVGAIAYTALGAGIVTAGIVMGAQATKEIISSDSIEQYMQDTNETVLKGKYAENMTTMGMLQRFTLNVICPATMLYTCGQDFFYNVTNWKGTPGQVLETSVEALGFFGGGAHAFKAIKNMRAVSGLTGKTPKVKGEAKAPATKEVAEGAKSTVKATEGASTPKQGDPNFIGPLKEIDAARAASWTRPDGSTWWPPNNGAVPSSEKIVTMKPGETFGRIGNNKGSYVAPPGTSPENLSLKPGTDVSIYKEYKIIKEIPNIQQADVAPWFDMPGGGTQFKLPMSIEQLLKEQFIVPIN